MGRRGKYQDWIDDPDKLILLEGWARNGLTDEQIAHNMGIAIRTLYEWKEKYPQLMQALKRGKEVVDILVENALFKRAIGYDYEETIIESEPSTGKKKIRKERRHMPGNTTAQIFWLKNRKPEVWKAKPVVEYTEEYEDDGLLAALDASMDDYDDDDDSFMLPEEDDDS